jgi:hypothetical protein
MKDCHTHARAPPPPPGRAVARGRSDLGPNIPFKRPWPWLVARNRPFPVLWLVTDVSYCRQFPVLMRDRFCPLFFSLLLTAYKNGEGGLFQSRELQTTHSRPIFCEHRESGRAGLRNHRPQRYTCTGVQAIRFLGSVFATARVICLSSCFVHSLLFVVFPS